MSRRSIRKRRHLYKDRLELRFDRPPGFTYHQTGDLTFEVRMVSYSQLHTPEPWENR